jgi:hypothetical protein
MSAICLENNGVLFATGSANRVAASATLRAVSVAVVLAAAADVTLYVRGVGEGSPGLRSTIEQATSSEPYLRRSPRSHSADPDRVRRNRKRQRSHTDAARLSLLASRVSKRGGSGHHLAH